MTASIACLDCGCPVALDDDAGAWCAWCEDRVFVQLVIHR